MFEKLLDEHLEYIKKNYNFSDLIIEKDVIVYKK